MKQSPTELEKLSAVERREMLAGLLCRAKPSTESTDIVTDPASRFEPFPLTDVQYAYWLGQQGLFPLGNVSAHAYFEFDAVLDLERIERAWNRLVAHHDMLRAVISNGEQRILECVPLFRIPAQDLRGKPPAVVEQSLLSLRDEMSHQVRLPDHWPLFDVRASILEEGRGRLHIGLNLLTLDAWSIRILLAQWFVLYDQINLPLPRLDVTFRDYVLAEHAAQNGGANREAEAYWKARLATLPAAPALPLAKDPRELAKTRFMRLAKTLEPALWGRLKKAAGKAHLTPSGLLLAAFGTVLRRWSETPRFTINVTIFNRRPLHPQVNELIGDFTSTMLVTFDASMECSFRERAKRLQKQFWRDLDHAQYSGIRVVRDLMREQKRDVSTVMPVVFTSILGTGAPVAQLLSAGEFVYGISQTPQVWLDHQVMEQGDTCSLTWDAVEDLFPAGLLSDMFEAYCDLLGRLANDPSSWDHETVVELPSEQLAQRTQINATSGQLSHECLHTLFSQRAAAAPDDEAVVGTGRRLTYIAIEALVERCAARLVAVGAQKGRPIAIALPRGWEQVVATLGILKAGAAYLPIDPDWPEPRRRQMLAIGEVDIVVTSARLASELAWPDGMRCVPIDEQAEGPVNPATVCSSPNDLAYVIFTSGSTGTPKGVMTDHRGAVNTILDINERFDVGPHDRVLALSALNFDLSVYDIFGVLAAGGTVIYPEPEAVRDPQRWIELIQTERITIWNTVPVLMEILVGHLEGRDVRLDSLRLVMLSGDWIPVGLPDRIRRLAPNARVIGLGGATEASIWSIYYPIERVDPEWTSIPYGRPLRNQRWHVLNEALQPCPTWVAGDLYIAGLGLARGYWGDEAKTRKSFFHHPSTGERIYRTGDRGRYLPDGNIEFLGRVDTQVKILGHRIELGEVENALSGHPAVQSVVAAAVGKHRERKKLVAYVVPRNGTEPSESLRGDLQVRLREHVATSLPCQMIPSEIVLLDKLPLTANGKIDRTALPDPFASRRRDDAYQGEPPVGVAAQMAVSIAAELGVEKLDLDANLLEMGADSLDMVGIAKRVEEEFGFQPSLTEFFKEPTIRALADAHERAQKRPTNRTVQRPTDSTSTGKMAFDRLILDPTEREAFKSGRPGLRPLGPDDSGVALEPSKVAGDEVRAHMVRRSHRVFSPERLSGKALGRLMSCLRAVELNGSPKYRYGSAGGLYPVQTYVHVKHERVDGLDGGTYYHHPIQHVLFPVSLGADIPLEVHDPFVNRGMFDKAAFSLFLITQLRAIEPLYGEHALHFSTIEAGLMTQVLEIEASRVGIGLCQVGWLDFDRIRNHFLLDEGHRLVHSLVGGPLPLAAGDVGHPLSIAGDDRDREEGEV